MERSEVNILAHRATSKASGYSRISNYSDRNSLLVSKKDVIVLTADHIIQLQELFSDKTTDMFGDVDIHEEMYTAFLSLGVLSLEGDLVGAVVFKNYPNVKAVPPWCWLKWMRHIFGCESVTEKNSIWMHLLLWKEKYTNVFLKPILQFFFDKMKYKQYVMIAVPPGVDTIACLGREASRIMPRGHVNHLITTSLGLMARRFYVPNYKIRKAVEEDNDDIIPLIAKYSSILHESYGNYYIAEMLTRFPKSKRQIIVAEYRGYAVAVVILNEVVNYDIFNENFELVCFNGLKKPHEDDFVGDDKMDEMDEDPSEDRLQTISESFQFTHRHSPSQRSMEDEVSIDEHWRIDDSLVKLFGHAKEDIRDHHTKFSFSSHILNSPMEYRPEKCDSHTSWILNYHEYESQLYKEASSKKYAKMEWSALSPAHRSRAPPLNRFFGGKNAFVLEVAAASEGHDEALELLVEASFESFPDRNYCCITVPTFQPPVNFTDRFVKVPPQAEATFPHDLFLLHRNTVQPDVIIRMAVEGDKPYIEEFFNQMKGRGNVREQVEFAMTKDPEVENCSNLCFLMIAYRQIVGLAVLSENIELDYILSHYEVFKWVDASRQKMGSYAVIEHLLLYPIFQNYALFFMTQMHTQADYSVIFYMVSPEDMSSRRSRLICNAVQHLIPIVPRMVQDYSPKYLEGDCMPSEQITKHETPYTMFLSTMGMSSIPRVEINTRIVVVGSGRTAASFLETLICTSSPELYTTFSGVVVVSPHNIAHKGIPNSTRDLFFVHRSNCIRRFVHLAALRTHLNFTAGIVTEIRRQDKRIFLSDGSFLPYDILVIMAGEQYQSPVSKKRSDIEMPSNVFIINTDTDASYALNKLNEIMVNNINPGGKVIVYGHELRSHCTLAALREFGIPSDLLVFVNPISKSFDAENLISYDKLIYDDPEVDTAMLRILQREGVTLYQGFFDDWVLDSETNLVTKVKFECYKRVLTLECKCIFMYTQKYISRATFQAIINAGLVFDGRLVIDAKFRTNDPFIFAAGSVTKYSRKYHADHKSHLYFNSEEIGEKLALHIRNMLIPERYKPKRSEEQPVFLDKLENRKSALPRFTKPLVKLCRVYGNLNYCHITKPGKQIPAELEVTKANFGQLYITGDLDNLDKQGYFRIHVNEFKQVETITCLTKDEIYVHSLLQIWGKHVKMLNNLQLRFELMMIPDLFDFFKEPWTCGIYYDRFKEARQKIRRYIVEAPLANGKSLAETTYDYLNENEWRDLTKQQKIEILQLFDETDLRSKIEEQIVEYIEENAAELPMYAHPSLIRSILHDYDKSPMFCD